MSFFAFLSCMGSVLGGIILLLGFMSATGAPQEAAIAALAVAMAVLPYVFFRALQLSGQERRRREFYEAVLRRIDALEE